MPLDIPTIKEGDVVSYEDMANLRVEYIVVSLPQSGDPMQQFGLLQVLPGRLTMSDCRQHGWNLVRRGNA